MKYIRYEIEKREYSSNIIVGISIHINNGKEYEKKHPLFCSFLRKSDGDKQIKIIFDNYYFKL
jgi:hypothetical protein